MITIELNGKLQTLPPGSTVTDLLSIIGSDGNTLAIVVNEQIIRPDKRSTHQLQNNNRVEILVFAGGG